MDRARFEAITEYLRDSIKGTEFEGHVYAVGGCCRDLVMGRDINDIDLAVDIARGSLRLAEMLHEKGLTVSAPVTFPRYSTAMFRLREFPDEEIEAVQTRRGKYTPEIAGHPELILGSVAEDAVQRDLTINSMFYDLARGSVIDVTGKAMDDIAGRIIRTPGDADATLDDDPVRVLRCIRFAVVYGWEIDPATFEAMGRNARKLESIKVERIASELDKMLASDDPARAMRLIEACGALSNVMPCLEEATSCRLKNRDDNTTRWDFIMSVLEKVENDAPVVRMAALLNTMGHRGEVYKALSRLHYDRAFIRKVEFLVKHCHDAGRWGPEAEKAGIDEIRALQRECRSTQRWERLLDLIDAINRSRAKERQMEGQVEAIRRRAGEQGKAKKRRRRGKRRRKE